MFKCDVTTKIFEFEPAWTSGCQSDPNDYVRRTVSEKTESYELSELKDRTFKVYLDAILINPTIESIECVNIEISNTYNKWPDEYGETRTYKKMRCKKSSAHTDVELNVLKVELNNYQYSPTDINYQCHPKDTKDEIELKKEISNIFFQETAEDILKGVRLNVEILKRK